MTFPTMQRHLPLLTAAALALAAATTAPAAVTLRLVPERDLLREGQADEIVLQAVIDTDRVSGARRARANIALVLDVSGSMEGEKMRNAREAAVRALDYLHDDDLVTVIAYSSSARVVCPPQPARHRARIASAIRELEAGGSTALYEGVQTGARELAAAELDGAFQRVILLSDGLANVGPSSTHDLRSLGYRLAGRDLSVTTIGLGLDYNEDLMSALARAGEGNTWFVESPRDLARIFSRELDDVTNIAARDVILRFELPEGVEAVEIIGREGTIRGRTVEIPVGQVVGGREAYALVKVKVAPGRGERSLGTVRVTYQTPENEAREAAAGARVRTSRDEAAVAGAAKVEVQRAVAANVVAAASDRALDLEARGQREEAVRVAREAAGRVRAMSSDAQVQEMAGYAELNAGALADADGVDNATRKGLRAANAQIMTQQAAAPAAALSENKVDRPKDPAPQP